MDIGYKEQMIMLAKDKELSKEGFEDKDGEDMVVEDKLLILTIEKSSISWYCTKPRVMCGYYHNIEHDTKNCPNLVEKREKKKRIMNMISIKSQGRCQLGLAQMVGRNVCYPPHPGSILTSDMLRSQRVYYCNGFKPRC
jgi:hypothetical protein